MRFGLKLLKIDNMQYRVWDTSSEEMVYPDNEDYNDFKESQNGGLGYFMLLQRGFLRCNDGIILDDWYDKYITQFCTELRDSVGTLIYDGDILEDERLDGTKNYFRIWFTRGGFVMNQFQDDFYKLDEEIYFYEALADMQNASFISGSCLVIGNIFENKELLIKK